MNLIQQKLPLRKETSIGWIDASLADFDSFLIDHAACERKASALAMSFVVKYADKPALVEPMICLAKEELAHFHEVYRIIHKRGGKLGADEKDPYVQKLMKSIRNGRDEHFLDRLLVSGVIEARGCERFYLMGEHVPDPEMAEFYRRLAREEAGHYTIFVKIAKQYFDDDIVETRLDQWWDLEAEAMLSVPFRAAVH
ncbi:tRNA-(ms[2]io[6]A)-hydroxylase [Pseudobacteriovorax antillogorgiicola]|uniref:tRNA-(Ms[2]io[6]A)-hydroxylase n=1 Tax=Pseudobacteriovorax antillogorgiicola TaxID=1513793 RepID=A0A1Y6C2S3_9BACT|nr:tRNA-(ms[2]io[6]A)-hydroxylase [Pseudobacteriovorax antillogorgiicola]TCS50248.1 tRNA-(ms[2]io[6]A)-hydroxylase [Pseudobacteriovorax antillogorgiicola]SMF32904.1 tRNA-(ms[2]io[6]A)-hydroxylase [Pseudobacteriovorax antillogorgiicola]